MTDSLYHESIKRLAEAAHGRGKLEQADGEARLDNPLCGDRVTMQVSLAHGLVRALAHQVKGCLLCRASASVIGLHAPGENAVELERIGHAVRAMLEEGAAPPPGWDELGVFAPVRGHRSRHGCVLLPFRTLSHALGASPSDSRAIIAEARIKGRSTDDLP